MNGLIEKIAGILLVAYVGTTEWRIRGKVSRKEFDLVVAQGTRLESHIWDIMKAQNIKPSIEPPDEIKNNNNRKET